MPTRVTLALFAIAILAAGAAGAQPATAPQPSSQGQQGMAGMPGMGGGAPADMATMMRQCAQMKAEMKSGTRMTLDMKPTMDRCEKMERGMAAAKAPDDTLSR